MEYQAPSRPALDFPIDATYAAILTRAKTSLFFRAQLERWMRDDQGWLVTTSNFDENAGRAARFTCYVLVNRLCFYNALKKKYELRRLVVGSDVITGSQLRQRLESAFSDAKGSTGDYETVFDGDFGDQLPYMGEEAIGEWRSLIRQLDRYNFANIPLDVIGALVLNLLHAPCLVSFLPSINFHQSGNAGC